MAKKKLTQTGILLQSITGMLIGLIENLGDLDGEQKMELVRLADQMAMALDEISPDTDWEEEGRKIKGEPRFGLY